MKLRTLALAALAACAGPLAAQDVIPPRPTLLRVAEGSDGTVLALDSAAIARTGDSTFVVNAVYHFAPDTARKFDGKMELRAVDCGRTRIQGGGSAYFDGNTPLAMRDETAGPANGWQPVEAAELPIFQSICSYLLGSFAARLPVTVEAMALDQTPAVANRDEVAQALMRGYPSGLRDAGVAGVAMVRLRVTEAGRADPASLRALWATHPAFGQAALAVARRIRWTPAQMAGHPVAAWALVPVTFYLQQ